LKGNRRKRLPFFIFVAMTNVENLQSIASQVRRDIVRMVHRSQSGHPGGSLGCADLLTALYFESMHHNPDFSMEGKGEDVFFLSNGHISPLWYSVLARSGYFDVSELASFRAINSRLQGHPATHEGLPGVRIASGSLGQGISAAIGVALAKKMDGDPHLVYVLTGDGEQQEGQIWEAALSATHHKVDNLIAIVDRNFQQIDGNTEQVNQLGDIASKWEAFGWDVLEMEGNQMEDVVRVLSEAQNRTHKGKPIMIVMKTIMGFGVDFMMHSHKWHGIAPNDEQLANALSQLPQTLGDYPIDANS
jgi:transketolase